MQIRPWWWKSQPVFQPSWAVYTILFYFVYCNTVTARVTVERDAYIYHPQVAKQASFHSQQRCKLENLIGLLGSDENRNGHYLFFHQIHYNIYIQSFNSTKMSMSITSSSQRLPRTQSTQQALLDVGRGVSSNSSKRQNHPEANIVNQGKRLEHIKQRFFR